MPRNCSGRAKILFKARPTPQQLRDRLVAPLPDGIEMYLAAEDIVGPRWLDDLVERVDELRAPDDFVYVVEGPLRSLDGSFFDISQNTVANREILRRLVAFGERIGAKAAVIHVIVPREDVSGLSDVACEETMLRCLPLIDYYVRLCVEGGLLPTVENMPPVTQMREEKFMHSPIGMEPDDLILLTNAFKDLRVTLDVSHAQLYLNAAHANAHEVPAEISPLVAHLARRRRVSSLDEYITAVEGVIAEAHISNATGLAGEGMPYGDGDIDLDPVTVRLSRLAQFLVTETIEPDPDRSTLMRDAFDRMRSALHLTTGEKGT